MSTIADFLLSDDYSLAAYIVGSCDTLVFLFSSYQLYKIIYLEYDKSNGSIKESVPKDSIPKKQKREERVLFQAMISSTMLIKGLFFLTYPLFLQIPQKTMEHYYILLLIWKHFGSLLFLLAYLMLFVFWQDVYYQLQGNDTAILHRIRGNLIPIFVGIIGSFIGMSVIGVFTVPPDKCLMVDDIVGFILAAVSLLVAIAFVFFYGILLNLLFKKYRVLRVKVMPTRKVTIVVIGCTLCFICRSALELFSIYIDIYGPPHNDYQQWSGPTFLVLIFYLLFETTPGFAMVLYLRPSRLTTKSTEKTPLLN